MHTRELTPRQKAVYDFVLSCVEERGQQPVYRETMNHFGWRSPNAIVGHYRAIEKKGFIRVLENGTVQFTGLKFKAIPVPDAMAPALA